MTKLINIENKIIGGDNPCFIIAEAGVNHNGKLDIAKQLIDFAVKSGADAVKFQTFKTENLILPKIDKAPYQKETTGSGESQAEMLKVLEIDKNFHKEIIRYCEGKNIIFLSTPYGVQSLDLLIELGVSAFKIASTDTTNLLFLEKVAKTAKPVILSTGMSTLAEIELAYECLKENGCKELAFLKCTSNYPTDYGEVNLNGMLTLKEHFDIVVGFSDHTENLGASPYAVAMGAKIVEKHFTIDKDMKGPDHKASLSPEELVLWVKEIRKVEQMLGNGKIVPADSEKKTKESLQKYIVSKDNLKKEDRITRENIIAKRTGGQGIPASEIYRVLGSELMKNITKDQPINFKDLKK